MEILYKSKNIIAINKPSGMPTAPDKTGDTDAMSALSDMLSQLGENSSLWLIHRLDRGVSGVLVFARNKRYSAILSELVANRGLKKKYYAVVEGESSSGKLSDYLYKDARINKAFVVKSNRLGTKLAELSYNTLETAKTESGPRSLVDIELFTGRFHQIRVQFSSRRLSLVGDGKYGSRDKKGKGIALFAYSVSFKDGNDEVTVKAEPMSDEYPWNLFSKLKGE